MEDGEWGWGWGEGGGVSGVCELGGGGRGRGEVREWRRDGVLRRGGGVLWGRVRGLRGVSL